MLSRERLQKTSGGLRRRKLPTINRDTLHFVSTTSPNFCFPGEAFKLAVIASISQNAVSYFSILENVEKDNVQRPNINLHVMKG